mmetsp:Transcript_31998/g.57369  ORF Transcript_31998/g.57369 Transcript_31998/m.57369 type:complete len:1201 (+) Transcript_31998:143-3745(+)
MAAASSSGSAAPADIFVEVDPLTLVASSPSSVTAAAKKAHKLEVRNKFLREKGTKANLVSTPDAEAAAAAAAAEEEEIDLVVRHAVAKVHMMKSACTKLNHDTQEYEHKPITTPLRELGEYGVGVQLYFEYLFGLGLCFLLLQFITIPIMHYCHQGSMIEDFAETRDANFLYKFIVSFSPGNLGACPEGGCLDSSETQNRLAYRGTDELLRTNITHGIGVADLLAVIVFLLFGLWFQYYWIPRTERINDEAHVTAADFAVEVACCPRKLPGDAHADYEDHVRKHFIKVLKLCGVSDEEAIIPEVALIREYDGCIMKFMAQGKMLENYEEHKAAGKYFTRKGNEKAATKCKKKEAALMKKIIQLEDSLEDQAETQDKDREVCGFFVIFNKEQHKQLVLAKYRSGRLSYLSRVMQKRHLRFFGTKLHVSQACEPTDLFWENLDYSHWNRSIRKTFTLLAAVVLVLSSTFLLNLFRATDSLRDTSSQPFDMWQVSTVEKGCLELCEINLSPSVTCEGSVTNPVGIVKDGLLDWREPAVPPISGKVTVSPLLDGNKTCASAQWQSTACTDPSFPGNAEVGFIFENPTQVECFNFQAPKGTPRRAVSLFGCHKPKVVNGSGQYTESGEKWIHLDQCVQFSNLIIGRNYEGNGDEDGHEEAPERVRMERSCIFEVSFKAAQKGLEKGENPITGARVSCFCFQQMALGLVSRFDDFTTPVGKVCEQWVNNENKKAVGKYAAIGVVIVLNNVLLFVFTYLDVLARHKTATDLANHQMISLFLSEFVNTGIIYIVVGMQLHGSAGGPFMDAMKFGQGQYDDFNPSWFITVGMIIFTTVVVQAICTTMLPWIWVLTVDRFLRYMATSGVVTQELLNDNYVQPEWTLSLRVAETLVIVYCVMFYSGAFPLLYIFGALYCLLAYWVDKWTLLRGSRVPPQYTKTAIEFAVELQPYAVLGHLAITMWVYGKQELMPSDWSSLLSFGEVVFRMDEKRYNEVVNMFASTGLKEQDKIFSRYIEARMLDLFRQANKPLVLLAIAMAIVVGIKIIFWFFSPVLSGLKTWIDDKAYEFFKAMKLVADTKDTTETYLETKANVEAGTKMRMLLSYQLGANDRYEEAVEALKFNPTNEARTAAGAGDRPKTGGHGFSFGRLEAAIEDGVSKIGSMVESQTENAIHGTLGRLNSAVNNDPAEDLASASFNEEQPEVVTSSV